MERFRNLAESLPHLVWTCRASDGACTYLSPQWGAYTGVPESAQLGFAWLSQLHPDDVERTKTRWADAAEAGVFDVEFRIRRHDGAYRWFKTRAVRTLDEGGEEVWYGSNTDIQDLLDARAAAEAANAELAARVDARTRELGDVVKQLELAQHVSQTGSWSFDLRANVVRWSDELFRIFRLPVGPEAVPYADQAALFAPASWGVLQAAVARAAEQGVGYELTLEIVRVGGERGVAVARAEAVRDADGVALLVGTFQDVTERERTAEALRKSNERLHLATEAAQIGIWEWNMQTDALVWDEGMFRLYGVSADEFTDAADSWRRALHPEDAEATAAFVAHVTGVGAPYEHQFRIVRGDGAIRFIRAFGAVVHEDGARRVIGVNLDVTEQRVAAIRLEEANSLLEERSRQKEVLLQEVHHRVKNNLQVIASLINMQLRKVEEPAARAALAECRSRVDSIALIHEQLYTSRDYAKVPLADYFAQLTRNIISAASDPGRIALDLDVAPLHIGVDKAIPCGLILNELVTNAIKHAFPDARRGTVRVVLATEGGRVTFSVADDGIGTPLGPAKSTSLGLHLVGTLVRQLDGALAVDRGVGTRHTVSFPVSGD